MSIIGQLLSTSIIGVLIISCETPDSSHKVGTRQEKPRIVGASLVTNAEIVATHRTLPDFRSSHVGQSFQLPYIGGPNMQYGSGADMTGAWSLTEARQTEDSSTFDEVSATYVVTTRLGGQSGAFGKGGHGVAAPALKVPVELPKGSAWRIEALVVASASGVANNPPDGPLAACNVRIVAADQRGEVAAVARDGAVHRLAIPNAVAGQYEVSLSSPALLRGSYGGQIGQRDEGQAVMTLVIRALAE